MIWIYGYCALAWLAALAILWSTRSCDDEYASEVAAAYPVYWRAMQTLGFLLMPVILPLAVILCGYPFIRNTFADRKMMQAAKQYREPQFNPINFFDLQKSYRDGFQRWTDEFLGQGFDLLGDFQNKFDPLPVYNRYFTGCDGTVFGDVTGIVEECSPGFLSVLEDGTYVETSGAEPYEFEGELTDEDHFGCTMSGECSLAELLEEHLRMVDREVVKRATRVLAFCPEQFQEIAVHGERRFKRWRQRCGERTGDVPDPVAPQGKPLEPSAFAPVPCRNSNDVHSQGLGLLHELERMESTLISTATQRTDGVRFGTTSSMS